MTRVITDAAGSLHSLFDGEEVAKDIAHKAAVAAEAEAHAGEKTSSGGGHSVEEVAYKA
jgi:hypothetical protein